MESFATNLDVVKILSYGASGLSFLLMFLAYNIIRKEQDRRNPRQKILNTVYVYMLFTLLNMVVVGVVGVPTLRDNQLLSEKTTALKLENYKVNSLYEIQRSTQELEQNADNLPPDSIARTLERNAQKLDTLSKALGEEESEQKAELEQVRESYQQKAKAVSEDKSPQKIRRILRDVNQVNQKLDKAIHPKKELSEEVKKELEKKIEEQELRQQ